MAGTKAGGKAAAATNKTKYGSDFYAKIGAKGGSSETKKPKGFASMDKKKLIEISKKGGYRAAAKRWDKDVPLEFQ